MKSLSENETCPACGGSVSAGFKKGDCEIAICGGCGFGWAPAGISESHVNDVYGDAYFNGGGAGYDDYAADRELLVRRGGKYGQILKKLGGSGKLLDVGAAAGYLMEGFQKEGWEVSGVEPNDAMAAAGRGGGSNCRPGRSRIFEGNRGVLMWWQWSRWWRTFGMRVALLTLRRIYCVPVGFSSSKRGTGNRSPRAHLEKIGTNTVLLRRCGGLPGKVWN